jgi:hypothetical protein
MGLISLDFWIVVWGFETRFTTETQRAQRKISYDPIGRRRLDHKPNPLRNRVIGSIGNSDMGACVVLRQRRFLFGGDLAAK